jgi:hypothetical protein
MCGGNTPETTPLRVAQVMLALLKDGTMAIQTTLARALLQWPFLHDTSLLAAVMAVFLPAQRSRSGGDTEASADGASSALDAAVQQPWLYFNVLVTDSQLYAPVLDKVLSLAESSWPRVLMAGPDITLMRAGGRL